MSTNQAVLSDQEEVEIVHGASYRQGGKTFNVGVDSKTGQAIMNPGTPLFYWIMGLLWDKRYLRRGRDNNTYLLTLLRITSYPYGQSIFQFFRFIFLWGAYDSFQKASLWYSKSSDWTLFFTFVACALVIQWLGMKADREDEFLMTNILKRDGLQAAVNWVTDYK